MKKANWTAALCLAVVTLGLSLMMSDGLLAQTPTMPTAEAPQPEEGGLENLDKLMEIPTLRGLICGITEGDTLQKISGLTRLKSLDLWYFRNINSQDITDLQIALRKTTIKRY